MTTIFGSPSGGWANPSSTDYGSILGPSPVLDESSSSVTNPCSIKPQGNGSSPQVVPTPQPTRIMLGAIPGLQESTFAYVAFAPASAATTFPAEVLTGAGNQGHPSDQGFADRGDNYLLVADRILSDLSKAHSWNTLREEHTSGQSYRWQPDPECTEPRSARHRLPTQR